MLDQASEDLTQAQALVSADKLPIREAQLNRYRSMWKQIGLLAKNRGVDRSLIKVLLQMNEAGICTDSEEAGRMHVEALLRVGEHEQAVVEGGKLIKLDTKNIDA